MNQTSLEHLVEAHHLDFITAYKIGDFPLLHHVFALIETESTWNVEADSGYARGLMQVSSAALKQINSVYSVNFTYDDMFRPDWNVFVGVRYLRWLYRVFLDHDNPHVLAVMAYNWGVGNVQKWFEEKKENERIDESVPAETKAHLFDWIYWCEYWRKELSRRREKK